MVELTLQKVGLIKRIVRKILSYFLDGTTDLDRFKNVPMDSGLNDGFFVPWRGQGRGTVTATMPTTGGTFMEANSQSEKPQEDKRIVVKPVDVMKELLCNPTQFSLIGLDEKIDILKLKKSLISQSYAINDLDSLIVMLENRKRWNEFKDFFTFDTTNDEKIEALLKKYKLVRNSADIFVPELPKIAVKTMKKYSDNLKELCGKKPRFEVIATEESFEKTYDRRDPILFTQSPFGLYYYVIGAWDSEMVMLGEL